MKKRILRVLMGAGVLFTPVLLVAQTDASIPTMVNIGQAYVAPNASGTTMLVTKSMVLGDGSDIYVAGAVEPGQNWTTTNPGKMAIGGSVYQNATDPSNGFTVDTTKPANPAKGKGIVSFYDITGYSNAGQRFVTTDPDGLQSNNVSHKDLATFTRADRYVAFPQIEVATADEVVIPARMGIDALNIIKTGTGKMRLESTPSGTSVFDASMRIVGAGSVSNALVPAGMVIVERDVSLYRDQNNTSTEMSQLGRMPFATPMENMRSGYFAGNFVRQTIADPATGHVDYVYADQKSTVTGKIDGKFYLTKPYDDLFKQGTAYVIDLRPNGFDYSQLSDNGGLPETFGSNNHDIPLIKFDGNVYTQSLNEQVFAQDVLYSKNLNISANSNWINWAIGNSYTAGIDVELLATAMKNSTLRFGSSIFVFTSGGAQGYQPVNIVDPSFNILTDLTEIPSQSTFIVQLMNTGAQVGSLEINKPMQTHGDVAHGANLAKGYRFLEEVLFKVTSEENPNFYDLTLIGFRPNAKPTYDSVDLEKVYSSSNNVFQMYSTSTDGTKLSGNALSTGTANAPLSFKPAFAKSDYVISTSRLESLTTEIVWLEDLKTGKTIDLRAVGEYEFSAEPGDNPNRFIVHFTKASAAREDITKKEDITIDYNNATREITIGRLEQTDLGSLVIIANAQGRIVKNASIAQFPQSLVDVRDLVDGVYIATVKGNRNAVPTKFVVRPQ